MRYWHHRHDFKPTEYGALVSDWVDYALPFGPLGRLAHGRGRAEPVTGDLRLPAKCAGRDSDRRYCGEVICSSAETFCQSGNS